MSVTPAPDVDAALILGMASTALPFAGTREEEAERWLRILRLHGEAGATLQGLGVSEGPLEEHEQAASAPAARGGEGAVADVGARATELAGDRGAQSVQSRDVLVAVMHVYGEDFDRVLRVHGTDRAEVLERLDAADGDAGQNAG
jgi:hypothetical protein